jgi:hypothetical protein
MAQVALEMQRAFISTLRLLAQFAREPLSKDLTVAAERAFSLREMINSQFRRSQSARRCCAIRNRPFSAAGPCFARSNRTLASAVADAFHNASCFVEIPRSGLRF